MPISFSDSHLAYAFWIGVGALGLTLLLALTMACLRLSLVRAARDEARFLSIWRPLLLSSLVSSVPAVSPVLPLRHRLYFLKLWNSLMRSAQRKPAGNLISIAYAVGCDHFSRRLLQHGNRVECLLATLTLAHLRDHAAWDLLVTQTMHADNVLSIHAFHALVQIDAEATAQQLTPLLLARDDWPVAHVAAILQSAQSAFMLPLLEASTEVKASHLIRSLRLIEALHLALPQAIILRLLQSDHAETVIAALRVANDVSLLPQIRARLSAADWRIRVQAAKALGRLGEHADVNRLIPLLADVEWWVRYRAAQALVGMPFFSRAEVELLHDNLSDRFARDMLGQVMAERKPS